ncbi:signal peptidase II [Tessaracoccus sp. OS52]|uniref:signal peptidase II n=1 Tax=Tessaracoccus sp. OS52 TaxID=2886691 RepID=UPI001D0F8E1E|nr:signal peptidase II [Tessaracoccus sp. OS52]MCC2593378.1 signal peptidase II [Tessaracoccus sp. OS52]
MTALGIGALGLSADQLTKQAALANLEWGEPVEVLGPVVRFTLISNPGAAFGMGSGSTLLLSLFAIVALAGSLTLGLARIRWQSHAVALGLLIAGISGNLYDRLFRDPEPLYGHVIDFVQLPYFAIFNVADVCITSAAAAIIVLSLRHHPEPATEPAPASDAQPVEANDA